MVRLAEGSQFKRYNGQVLSTLVLSKKYDSETLTMLNQVRIFSQDVYGREIDPNTRRY